MRSLHDDIERRVMLDLTGQDRPVPPIGRETSDASGTYRATSDVSGYWHPPATSAAESTPDRLAAPLTTNSGPQAQVHAGAAEGAGRAGFEEGFDHEAFLMQALRAGSRNYRRMSTEQAWRTVAHDVADTYAAAASILASAGPLPLISTEPWEEPIDKFASRLQRHYWAVDLSQVDEDTLEDLGNMAGLPRARLVPKQQGEP